MKEALAHLGDRYNASLLNRVMHGLKSLITFRTERGFELAAKREQQVGRVPVREGEKGSELSLFEKIFLARFEGAAELGEKLEPGKARFLAKSEKGWVEFFQKFLSFTVEKRGKISDLEALIYRGLLKGARPQAERGTLISDLKFLSGRTDKFARLQIQGSKILETLAEKVPGEVLAQALVAEWIGGPEFAYQSLSHRIVSPELMSAFKSSIAESYKTPQQTKEEAFREGRQKVSPGIALSARTEQLIAERLDLDMRSLRGNTTVLAPNVVKTSEKKRKGLFGRMFEDEADAGPVFVPWYQQILRFKKIPGKPKWWVPLLYFVAFSATALFVFYIFRFLLQR